MSGMVSVTRFMMVVQLVYVYHAFVSSLQFLVLSVEFVIKLTSSMGTFFLLLYRLQVGDYWLLQFSASG